MKTPPSPPPFTRGRHRAWEWYLGVASAALIYTAALKCWSVFAASRPDPRPDLLFLVPKSHLLLSVALVELGVAGYLLFGGSIKKRSLALLGLSGCFVLYRMAVWSLEPLAPCDCLGLAEHWPLFHQHHLNLLSGTLLVYLFVGSLAAVLTGAWSMRTSMSPAGLSGRLRAACPEPTSRGGCA